MSPKPRTGRITGSYATRAQERVWIIAWDDGGRPPPIDIEEAPGLREGCRVRLVGARLERAT